MNSYMPAFALAETLALPESSTSSRIPSDIFSSVRQVIRSRVG
jgi:hypothetical protein